MRYNTALLLLLCTAVHGASVIFQDPKACPAATTKINTVAPFFGTQKLNDLSIIKDTIKTTLTRFDDGLYNNTALCTAKLEAMGPCLDEITLEVFASAYVQITPSVNAWVGKGPTCNVSLCMGATGMLQPGAKAITGSFLQRGSDQVGSFFTLKPEQDDDQLVAVLSLPLFGAANEGDVCQTTFEAENALALQAAFMGMGVVSQTAG